MGTAVSLAIRNALMREGVQRILSASHFDITDTTDNLGDLQSKLPTTLDASILVIDHVLLGPDAAGTVAALHRAFPQTRIVTLTDTFDFAQMVAIYAAGAHAYFLDHLPCQSLVAMMQMVAVGQKFAPPDLIDLLDSLLLLSSHPPNNTGMDTYNLTDREQKILAHLGQGLPNKRIAREINATEAATKASVKSILKKLGVRNRTQAAVMARELASPEPVRLDASGPVPYRKTRAVPADNLKPGTSGDRPKRRTVRSNDGARP